MNEKGHKNYGVSQKHILELILTLLCELHLVWIYLQTDTQIE